MSINDIRDTFKGEKSFTEVVKTIGGTAVNVGVDIVVGTLLAAGLSGQKGLKRVLGGAGILVLSMKIGEVAEDYFCGLVDEFYEAIGKAKKDIEETSEESAEEKKDEE